MTTHDMTNSIASSNGVRRASLAAALIAATACFGCASMGKSRVDEARDGKREHHLKMDQELSHDDDHSFTAEEKIAEGDRLRDTGRLPNAALAYYEAVRMDPESAIPRERIAYLNLTRDVERAEATFLELVSDDPGRASAWRGLGLARMGMGNLDEAVSALQRAIDLDPSSAGAQYGLATVLGLEGQTDAAVVHARMARELRPKDAAVANVLGVSLMLSGDAAGAEEPLRDAVRLAPNVMAYHNNLGLCLGRQERYNEALQAFMRGGDQQAAYNNLGYSYFLNARYDDAIARYEQAMSMPGDHKIEVLRNLNQALDARDQSAASPDL